MKRFLVTSSKYAGHAELIYGSDGTFIKLSVSDTNMTPDQKSRFKASLPVLVWDLEEFIKGTQLIIVEDEYEVSFEDFIRDYGYKRNTHIAKAYWPRMPKYDQILASQEATPYRKYCDRNKEWYNPMLPDTWLKKKQFLNNWKQL